MRSLCIHVAARSYADPLPASRAQSEGAEVNTSLARRVNPIEPPCLTDANKMLSTADKTKQESEDESQQMG